LKARRPSYSERIGGMMDRNKQQQLEVFGIEIEGLKGEELLAKKVAFDGLPEPSDNQQDLRLLQRLALEVTLQREFGVGNTQTALEGFRSSLRVAATGMAAASISDTEVLVTVLRISDRSTGRRWSARCCW
jgi:hypothetical protein